MNIAGMVLGIVAVTLAWIPLIGIVSIPLVLVGMPLSILSLRQRLQNGESAGKSSSGNRHQLSSPGLHTHLHLPLRDRRINRHLAHSLAAMTYYIARSQARRNPRTAESPLRKRAAPRRRPQP